MKILVTHLTRMHAGRICVAGVDVDTLRHVRPVVGREGLTSHLLARYGGPFDMARIVDLGCPRHKPDRPHVEDYEFSPARVRFRRSATAEEFWQFLQKLARPRLDAIFGEALHEVSPSRYGTDVCQGTASLGYLRPSSRPKLYVKPARDGKRQVRMKLTDGRLHVDAGVTDLRLFGPDHATPDAGAIRMANRWLDDSKCILLGMGLTRKFRPNEGSPYVHYLQVNNVHVQEEPTWALG